MHQSHSASGEITKHRRERLTYIVLIEHGLALLQSHHFRPRHLPALEIRLPLRIRPYPVVRTRHGGEAIIVVQRGVPLDAVVVDRETLTLFLGGGGGLHVVAVPGEGVIFLERVDEEVEQFCGSHINHNWQLQSEEEVSAVLSLWRSKEAYSPNCISPTPHPMSAAETVNISALPYHSRNTSSPRSGCMTFCTPQTSSPAVQGGNCLPTTRTWFHLCERAREVIWSAAVSRRGRSCEGIREGTMTKPLVSYWRMVSTNGDREMGGLHE